MAAAAKPLCDLTTFLDKSVTVQLSDDFTHYNTGDAFTSVATGSGSTAQDDTGGTDVLKVITQAADNDIQGWRTTKAPFLFQAQQPAYAKSRVQFANVSGNNANIIFGFMSTTTLTMTDGIDPSASYSGAVIYKLDGGAVWKCQTSNGSTKTTTASTAPATDGTYDLMIQVQDRDGLNALVTFWVNGKQLVDSNNIPIVHVLAYASLAKMYIAGLSQAGSAGALTSYWDFVTAAKLRLPQSL